MEEDLFQLAMKLAAMVGKLTATLNWCVEHDGECLADNPAQLAEARRLVAEARADMGAKTNVPNKHQH